MPPTPEDIDAARACVNDWEMIAFAPVTKADIQSLVLRFAATLSAARERGAREQMEREPLHRAIVEAAMRYEDESGGHEERALFAAVRALREATGP